MGRQSPFTKPQTTDLKAIIDEYEQKIKDGGLEQDGLLQWKKDKCEDFLTKHQSDLEGKNTMDIWRGNVMRTFINFNAQLKRKRTEATSNTSSHPLLQFSEDTVVQGRELFRKANATTINNEAAHRREAAGEDSKKHAGYYQRVLKEKWEKLTEDERTEWTEKAEVENQEKTGNSSDVYSNQEDFDRIVTDIFRGMIGQRPNCIGDAQFHLLFGMRKADDTLKLGCLTVGPELLPKGSRFQDTCEEYNEFFQKFTKFCEQTIPRVSGESTGEMVISRDATNFPVLPPCNDEDTRVGDMRMLLQTFMGEVWYYVWPKDDTMPTIPWDAIKANADDYIDLSFLPSGFTLCSPETMPTQDLFVIANHIHQLQNLENADAQQRKRFSFRTKAEIARRINVRCHSASQSSPSSPAHDTPGSIPSASKSDRTKDAPDPNAVHDVNDPDPVHDATTSHTESTEPETTSAKPKTGTTKTKRGRKGKAGGTSKKRKLATENDTPEMGSSEPVPKRKKPAAAEKPPVELVIQTRRQKGLTTNTKVANL